MTASRIVGFDPGSIRTGFGVIDVVQRRMQYVASGIVRAEGNTHLRRLESICKGSGELLGKFRADELALEEVFVGKNAGTAVKLGQARGVVLAAAFDHGVPVFEYAARRIKLAVTGAGSARKALVRQMVASILSLDTRPPEDSADALAAAICHIHEKGRA
ncbi:MAG: crossover junction endodeoxyribonuclease RuvC [Pseudomonadales bacterium]|nr:crossover junction endodeoxyribonuclease RuvC [Pseudomonadales bacterium]